MSPINEALVGQICLPKSSDQSRICRLLVDQLNGQCLRANDEDARVNRACSLGFRAMLLQQSQAMNMTRVHGSVDHLELDAESVPAHDWMPSRLLGVGRDDDGGQDLYITTWVERINESAVRAGVQRLGRERATRVVRSRDSLWFNNAMRVTLAVVAWSVKVESECWVVVPGKNGERPKPGMTLPQTIDMVGFKGAFERTDEVRYLTDGVAMCFRRRSRD